MVSRTTETYDPAGLLAGGFPAVVEKVTIADSAALEAGAVLGRITSGGKYLLSASAAEDGSEAPKAILAEAADASDGDVEALAYVAGAFEADKLSFGAGHTADTVATALRAAQAPLFLVSPVA